VLSRVHGSPIYACEGPGTRRGLLHRRSRQPTHSAAHPVNLPVGTRLPQGRGAERSRGPAIRFACCLEPVAESDAAPGKMPVEGQGEEDLLRYSLVHESRHVPEPESPVVIRMSNETTSHGRRVR